MVARTGSITVGRDGGVERARDWIRSTRLMPDLQEQTERTIQQYEWFRQGVAPASPGGGGGFILLPPPQGTPPR